MKSEFVENDYDAWGAELREWGSIELFCAGGGIAGGIHRINVGEGPTLDILIGGNLFEDPYSALPVFFTGAVSDRENKYGPFFSGSGISSEGDFDYISIFDPSTSLDSSLGLAWYAGNSYNNLPAAIETILLHIADLTGRHLLLVGGSGGGFAALHLGCLLGAKASVLVWNPQTNIFRYNSQFSRNYFLHAFGPDIKKHLDSPDWERATQQFLEDRSVRYELCTLMSGRPRRLLIYQNASDWHVQSHTAPLIDAWGFEHRGQGRYQLGMGGCLVVANFGVGHQPLPPSVVTQAVLALRDPAASTQRIVESLSYLPEFSKSDVRTLPRDLRDLIGPILEDISLDIQRHLVDSVLLRVQHVNSPQNYGGMTYSFFVKTEGGYLTRYPFGPEDYCIVGSPVTSYVDFGVQIRDGFNNVILELKSKNPFAESYGEGLA